MAFLLLLTWTAIAPQSTSPASATQLTARLQAIVASSGAEVAMAFRPLDGSSEVLLDADKAFHAASTMKVPVMIELFRQAQAGSLTLDDPLPIKNEFRSIVDGSPYQLSVGDDSDREVYANVGKTMTLRQLCAAMITVSSNFATNLLIEKLGVENIRGTVKRLGADGMQVLRGVEDQKAFVTRFPLVCRRVLRSRTRPAASPAFITMPESCMALDPTCWSSSCAESRSRSRAPR